MYLLFYLFFRDRNIPWENCIGYSSDNASVMTGKTNSVLSRLREKNPAVFNLGCVCHLANLCAQAGVKALPLPVDDLLIDVYFHFFHRLVLIGIMIMGIIYTYVSQHIRTWYLFCMQPAKD